jgi:hypothetical protein
LCLTASPIHSMVGLLSKGILGSETPVGRYENEAMAVQMIGVSEKLAQLTPLPQGPGNILNRS